jgi:hypothetical protein
MRTRPLTDSSGAAVDVVAQRIAGYADRHRIAISPAQCQELAEQVLHVYDAFHAGLRHAATEPTPAQNPGLPPADQ